MVLKNKLLILSYNSYVYKDGGFCISINPKNEVKCIELELSLNEIKELETSPLRYSNRIPNYVELLNKYFDELLNFNPIL